MFYDLELRCWRFYRVREREGNYPTRFREDSQAAWEWCGGEGEVPLRQLSADVLAPEQSAWFEQAQQVLDVGADPKSIEWQSTQRNGEKVKRAIDAWRLLDTYYIELAVLKEGKVSVPNEKPTQQSKAFESLLPKFPSSTSDDYLGEGRCWCLCLDRVRPNERLLHRALQLLGLEPEKFSLASTRAGWFAIDPYTRNACILYHRSQVAELSEALLSDFLPQLFHILVKVDYCHRIFRDIKDLAKEIEESLEGLLHRASSSSSNLEDVESLCGELAQKQTDYLQQLKTMKYLVNTLHAQELSLLELFRHPIWRGNEDSSAARALRQHIQRAIRQSSIEVGYEDIVVQCSELVLESLNTRASAINAQWNRELNTRLFRLTAFAALGLVGAVAELFPEIPQSPNFLIRLSALPILLVLWGLIEIFLGIKQKISRNSPAR